MGGFCSLHCRISIWKLPKFGLILECSVDLCDSLGVTAIFFKRMAVVAWPKDIKGEGVLCDGYTILKGTLTHNLRVLSLHPLWNPIAQPFWETTLEFSDPFVLSVKVISLGFCPWVLYLGFCIWFFCVELYHKLYCYDLYVMWWYNWNEIDDTIDLLLCYLLSPVGFNK